MDMGKKWAWSLLSCDSKIDCILRINERNKLIFFNFNTNLGKLKTALMIFGWTWSKMGMAL